MAEKKFGKTLLHRNWLRGLLADVANSLIFISAQFIQTGLLLDQNSMLDFCCTQFTEAEFLLVRLSRH